MDGYRRCPDAGELEENRSCDTIVIGSGIAGMSTAYEPAMEGQKVIVVDRGAIAGGITALTSAHLAPLCDDLTSAMIELRGEDISRAFYVSQAAAVDRIEQIQQLEKIACDFRRLDGFLFQALDTDPAIIDEELDAVRKVGAPVHRIVGVEALARCEEQHTLRYPRQATSPSQIPGRAGPRHRGKGRPALRPYHRPNRRGTRWRSSRQD